MCRWGSCTGPSTAGISRCGASTGSSCGCTRIPDGLGATILHADLDAFYASVEQLLDPALRGRPVAVGGGPRGGVVLAASYEAKAHGVQGGMPGWRAARLCPDLVFVGGHFGEYQRLGDAVMAVLADVTPTVERISIDEAFLDVAGATHLFGPPAAIGARIRTRVRTEVGLSISVGAARTKHLAKIASQVAKPDGLVVVDPGAERAFLDPLPVGLIWGVGPVNERRLADLGIRTIGELARTPSSAVEHILGQAVGHKLSAMAHDEDPRRVVTSRRARSVGAQSALSRRRPEPDDVRAVVAHLSDRVSRRLRAKGRAGRTVTVAVRFAGMHRATRSLTLPVPVAAAQGAARRAVDESMDAIRTRFGGDAVGYLPVVLRRGGAVPDEFRELAERDP
ncbi:DNA polymerase IV [Promicromonospora sp. CA-289599]|uniref:DNA polymerase IV n=1 Tax=Promicromonospora sp. CA-289599 TaxID=3240014 RepID=UPI003D89FFD8